MAKPKPSEWKRWEGERLASLSRLSAGLAHEINNPLGLILGYTQLMLKETRPGDQFYEDLRMVEKHARNCKKILEDLLKFSRSTETTKTPADLNDLVNEALSAVQARLEKSKIDVLKKFSPALPRVNVDSRKIKQVFMNILTNAEQALEGEGRITVATGLHRASRRVAASIADTGAGIAPEILHKIFDPFFTTRPTGMGKGLGLAVSHGIIGEHDGEIRVKSTPGKGSKFTVLLPLDERGARKEKKSLDHAFRISALGDACHGRQRSHSDRGR